jgi:choline monooxygenase
MFAGTGQHYRLRRKLRDAALPVPWLDVFARWPALSQPEFEGVKDWDRAAVALPEFRMETWGPFVFVNLDPQAPGLPDVLGDIPEKVANLGCDFGKLKYFERRDYVINCNWKVYIDNYLEGFMSRPRIGLLRELDYRQYRVDTYRYYSSHYAPLRTKAPPTAATPPRRFRRAHYWIFPNFMLNIYG